MIKYKEKRKIAVMEGDVAVVKDEEVLRISSYFVDFIHRVVRVVLHRGFINEDKTFTVTNAENIVIEIKDIQEQKIMTEQGIVTIPSRLLYTLLITPSDNHGERWAGDFRLKDIEDMITTYNLIDNLTFDSIINQV